MYVIKNNLEIVYKFMLYFLKLKLKLNLTKSFCLFYNNTINFINILQRLKL